MQAVEQIFGGKTRIRVCGLLVHEQKVLLVNHKGLNQENEFWNCPGGGLNAGENIHECLMREFEEEVSTQINIHNMLYINEFITGRLHAVELYFKVTSNHIKPKLGYDPELNLLTDLRWFSQQELEAIPESRVPNFLNRIAFR